MPSINAGTRSFPALSVFPGPAVRGLFLSGSFASGKVRGLRAAVKSRFIVYVLRMKTGIPTHIDTA